MHQTPDPLRNCAIILHQEMLEAIKRNNCEGCKDIEKLLANSVFIIDGYVEKLYELIPENGFTDPDEEIFFFKTLKPLFTVEKEYHQRLYHASVFGLGDERFREQEIVRMEKLLKEHSEFAQYYHKGCTDKDYPWFSQGQAPMPSSLCMTPWETNPRYTSARDSWVAGLLAVERYKEWLQTSKQNRMT